MKAKQEVVMNKKIVAIALAAGLVLSTGFASAASAHGGKGRGGNLDGVLSSLLSKGTLTQSQVDAIKKEIEDAHAAAHAAKVAKYAEFQELIAKTIGLDTATITSRITAGESLGAIAGSKRQALIDALVEYHSKRIDQAVTDGKITTAQATTLKSGLSASVTFFVDRVPGYLHMGKSHGKGFGKGFGMMKGPKGPKAPRGMNTSGAGFGA
jgi:Spy/CpxP family protein refolding chaperone